MCVCVFASVCESWRGWGAEHGGEHLTEAQASRRRAGNSWPFIDRFWGQAVKISLQSRGVWRREGGGGGGGTDIVPTGANCALQTYKYIKGTEWLGGDYCSDKQGRVIESAAAITTRTAAGLFLEKSRGQSLFVSNVSRSQSYKSQNQDSHLWCCANAEPPNPNLRQTLWTTVMLGELK